MLFRQLFFVNTVYHGITDNKASTRWPKRFIVSFGWFLSWRLSHCFEFSLFLLFSKDVDLWPALWRYSLCFSSLMVFSWSSVFLFEELWLMMFISLNLTSESVYLSLLQIGWESEVLHISRKSHISSSILSLLFFWVLLLRNVLIMPFLEQIPVLRDSISFWSVAIILLPTRLYYSSLLCRSNFCFSSFCINSFTSFFMFHSKISLIFFVFKIFVCPASKV